MKFKFLHILIFLAIFSPILLYAVSFTASPITKEIGDINESDVGLYISTKGNILKMSESGDINYLTLVNENSRITVATPKDYCNSVNIGAYVSISGIVRDYSNYLCIEVKSATDIIILNEKYDFTIAILLENPEFFEGMIVEVDGEVYNLYTIYNESRIEITDGFNKVWIYLDMDFSGDAGDELSFTGVLNYDYKRYFLGSNNSCENRISVSLEDLCTNPEGYFNQNISINGTVLLKEEIIGTCFTLIDEDYSLYCFVDGKEVDISGIVSLSGIFEYYSKNGQYELVVDL